MRNTEWEVYDEPTIDFETSEYIEVIAGGAAEYGGPYELIPSTEPQVIPIAGMLVPQDITVGAIPENYGLITYDGSTVTVS